MYHVWFYDSDIKIETYIITYLKPFTNHFYQTLLSLGPVQTGPHTLSIHSSAAVCFMYNKHRVCIILNLILAFRTLLLVLCISLFCSWNTLLQHCHYFANLQIFAEQNNTFIYSKLQTLPCSWYLWTFYHVIVMHITCSNTKAPSVLISTLSIQF